MSKEKLIFVTGGSKNLGAAIADTMTELGTVITVARSGDVVEQGDLLDPNFRQYLVDKYSPDIFINCAAKTENYSVEEILEFNSTVVVDLLLKFYDKAQSGCDIVNISSWRGWHPGTPEMNNEFIAYASTKHLLSSASQSLALQKKSNVRVMCLETGGILTSNYPKHKAAAVKEENYTQFNGTQITPMTPAYVASVVRWMIEQPRWVNPGVVRLLNNFQS
jgi:NAD(P)-dependent dehydrogenase (short-subunit alcohol dehydrogenase family)